VVEHFFKVLGICKSVTPAFNHSMFAKASPPLSIIRQMKACFWFRSLLSLLP
jgi:hypothetical protein